MTRQYRLDKLEMPALEELAVKARRKVLREGVRVIALKVREIAPDSGRKHTGKLNKTIRYQVRRAGLEGVVAAKAPHAHLVHDGTKSHEIPAPKDPEKVRRAFPLYAGGHAEKHPGARAQPFLKQAAEETRPQVEQVLREGTEAAIAEVAAGR